MKEIQTSQVHRLFSKILNGEPVTQSDFSNFIEAGLSNSISDLERQEYKLALEGGPCPYCGVEWRKNKVILKTAQYSTYVDVCGCLSAALHDERFGSRELAVAESARVPKKLQGCNIRGMELSGLIPETLAAIEKVKNYIKEELFINNGLILFGDVGAGKTHMAVSVLKAVMIKRGWAGFYLQMSDFFTQVKKSRSNYVKKILRENRVFLLDDLDKAGNILKDSPEWAKSDVFTLIDSLSSGEYLILATVNMKTLDDVGELFDSAIISRLLGSCYTVAVHGKDFRLERRRRT